MEKLSEYLLDDIVAICSSYLATTEITLSHKYEFKSICSTINDAIHGKRITYFIKEQLPPDANVDVLVQTQGNYINGLKHGEFITYNDKGEITIIQHYNLNVLTYYVAKPNIYYQHDIRNKIVKYYDYYESGIMNMKYIINQNKGSYISYYENGKIRTTYKFNVNWDVKIKNRTSFPHRELLSELDFDQWTEMRYGDLVTYDFGGNVKLMIGYTNGKMDYMQGIYYDMVVYQTYKDGILDGKNSVISYNIESTQDYKCGKLHGLSTKYENGVLVSSIEYRDELCHGEYKQYDRTSNTTTICIYDNNILTGEYYEYHGSFTNILKEYRYYVDGQIHGLNEVYYPNGQLKFRKLFNKGIVTDKYETFYENGSLKSVYDKDENGTVCKIRGFAVDGTIIYEGKNNDSYVAYYPETGNIRCRCYYDEESKSHIHEQYYMNGNLETRYMYKDGLDNHNGLFEEFYTDGTIHFRCTYLNNKLHGTQTIYNTDGTEKRIDRYVYDRLNGVCLLYAYKSTGKRTTIKLTFVYGNICGLYEHFDEDNVCIARYDIENKMSRGPWFNYSNPKYLASYDGSHLYINGKKNMSVQNARFNVPGHQF